MKRYLKMREMIHDGSKPPKLGTYTPPKPYLLESNEGTTLVRMGEAWQVSGNTQRSATPYGLKRYGWMA